MIRNYLSLIFLLCLGLVACTTTEKLSYSADIEPLLGSCSNVYCHGAYHPDGNTLTYENTVEFASQSKFLSALKHEESFSAMPKSGDKFSDETIELIEQWINEGMAE